MGLTSEDIDLIDQLNTQQTGSTNLLARGLRNNNPGNIVKTKNPWDGEVEGEDSRFKTFATEDDGLAAIGSNLLAYNDKHGLDTVGGIINRWAPPSENDTGDYVRSVASSLGVAPDQPVDVRNPEVMAQLSDAIVRKENGKNPYSREQMLDAAKRAISGRTKAAEIRLTVPDKATANALANSAMSSPDDHLSMEDVDGIADSLGVSRGEASQIMFGGGGPRVDFSSAAAARAIGEEQAKRDAPVDWTKKLAASIDSYQANLWSIPAAMGSEYALKAMQENKAAADQGFHDAGGPQSWNEMEFGKNFGQYFGHLFVQSAPYLAEFVATGFGIGSVLKKGLATTAESIATKAAAEAVTKGATAAQAAKIGNAAADGFFGTIGGVMGSYPSSTGDVLSNQYEQSGKFNLPAAAALGIPYAALNAAGVEGMMMRGLSRGLPEIAANVAGKGLAGAAGRAAITGAETGLIEGTTETGQEVMNQFGRMAVDPNATLTSGDAPERYKESFIAGSLMGGAMGAVAGPFRKPNSPLTNAANAAGGANAQGNPQVPPNSPAGGSPVAPGSQVPMGGQGAAPIAGQAGSPVPGAVPPVDPLTARNDAEIARFTQEMADAEARSEKLNSRAMEGVPDDRLQNIADEFAFKAQQGVPLTPEQQRVAENVANELEFRALKNAEAEDQGRVIGGIAQRQQVNRDNAALQQSLIDQETEAASGVPRPAPASGVAIIDQQVQAGVPLDQITATTPAAKARLKKLKKEAANGPTATAAPNGQDAQVAAPGSQGRSDVLPGSPALAPTDGNVQPAPGRDIPAAVATPSGGTAAPDGTAAAGRPAVTVPAGLTPGTPEYNAYFEKKAAVDQENRDAEQREQRRSESQAAVDKKNSWRKKLLSWFEGAKDGDTISTDMAGDDYRVVEKTIDRNGTKILSKRLVQVGGMGEGRDKTIIEHRDGKLYQGPSTSQTIDPTAGFAQAPETDSDSVGAMLGKAMEDGRAKTGTGATAPAEPAQPAPAAVQSPAESVQPAPYRNPDGVSLSDAPAKYEIETMVKVKRMVGSDSKTVEVSANEAIADLNEEISVYEKLLACVRGRL